jgi:hypothetical protein
MDDATRHEIDRVSWNILREAGIVRPPVRIERVLEHLQLHRDFYDLQNPTFLDRSKHKIRVGGHRFAGMLRSIKLVAVLLYDQNRIVVDSGLPEIKRGFPSFHEAAHRIFPWHHPFFFGDTAQTLEPDWHEELEADANYGASALMFCGPVFTREALDTSAEWASVAAMKERYGKSFVTTLRRYVEHSHDHPMAMLVSTPSWKEKPADQPERWRHFVRSSRFASEFTSIAAEDLLKAVDVNLFERFTGSATDFAYCLTDNNGDRHEFRVECFDNSYYVLTLLIAIRRLNATHIVLPASVMEN